MELKNGRTICVSSCKGGVGKTLTVLNLAGIYHLLDKKVLLIDLDLYSGAIALSLNVEVKNDVYDLIYDLKNSNYESFDNYITSFNEHIDVLPCPINIKRLFDSKYEYIEHILTYAKTKYDVILIDTTHYLNELNLLLHDICDLTVLIITNDLFDLKNTKNMLNVFREIKKTNYRIILNEAVDISKRYFTHYDIKKIINNNIDYTIENNFYIKDIDKYILNNEIVILNKEVQKKYREGFEKLTLIAKGLLNKEGGK